jgi:guanylate kinase
VVDDRPRLVVISGPSGVGKDAVLNELKKRGLPFHFVVTMTSRPPREGEVDGVDYLFTTSENFERLIQEDAFIEWARVYEQYKGIPRSQIYPALECGKDVFVRVDVQGSRTLRKLFPNAILIFLTAENEQAWIERFRNRKTDTPAQIETRLRTAKEELGVISEFDYLVVNASSRLTETADTILSILSAEHHRIKPVQNQD